MKRIFVISLLVGIIVVIALMGCDSTGVIFKPNDELFDYTCYAKGSYWVYEDSATHRTDSIAVITEPQKSISDDHRHGSSSSVKTFHYQYNYINNENHVNDTILFEPTVHGDLLGSGRVGDCPEDCYLYPIRPHGKSSRTAFALTYINLREPVIDSNNTLYFEDFYIPQRNDHDSTTLHILLPSKAPVLKANSKLGPEPQGPRLPLTLPVLEPLIVIVIL